MAKPTDKTVGEKQARQLLRRLGVEIKRAGPGTATSLDLSFGRQPGWMRWKRYHGRIALHTLLDVLARLELDPARFFNRVLGSPEAQQSGELARLDLEPLDGKVPKVVRKVRRRLRAGGTTDRAGVLLEELAAAGGSPFLDRLDRNRYRDPRRVVTLAAKAASQLDAALLPRLLGVAGSAYRLWNVRLDEAEHCLRAGIEIAEASGDRSSIADLLQRLSYVIADRGRHAESLAIVERAALIYQDAGDRAGMGRTAVARGMFLIYLGRPLEAIEVEKSALRYLPDEEQRHRFSALQHLGVAHQELGEPEKALRYAGRAEDLAAELGPLLEGKLLWLRASILCDLGHHDRAKRRWREVVEIYRPVHRGEMALATVELVRVQLLQERLEDAWETAESTRRLVWDLHGNSIVASALLGLVRGGQEALTLALVERVRATLEKARERPDWRSLLVRSSDP